MRNSLRVALFILAATPASFGATLNVSPGQSIQTAIDAATAGDEIVVAPGTYNQLIDFVGKAITVRSSGGPEVTILDGTDLLGSVVTCDTSEGPDSVLEGFTITGGQGTTWLTKRVGGGIFNNWAEPTLRDCVFRENGADEGGAMWNRGRDPMIVDCTFTDNTNTSEGNGGAAIYLQLSDPTLQNCIFADNAAANYGGAIYSLSSSPSFINTVFHGNTATLGAAVLTNGGSMTFHNCTFSANAASASGGAIAALDGSVTLYNSVLWGDSPDEIYDFASSAAVYWSTVMGGWSGAGANVSSDDPMFVNATVHDYHLQAQSPCVNAGDNAAIPTGVAVDLDNNARVVGTVDLGPYERQDGAGDDTCDADIAGPAGPAPDGNVDALDLLMLIAQWGSDCSGPCEADIVGPSGPGADGNVDSLDFLMMVAQWGTPAGCETP